MYVAMDQHYVTKETFDNIYQQADKTGKMISGLITYLRENDKQYRQKIKRNKSNRFNITNQTNQKDKLN
jgi:hypothetical protein